MITPRSNHDLEDQNRAYRYIQANEVQSRTILAAVQLMNIQATLTARYIEVDLPRNGPRWSVSWSRLDV